MKRQFFFRRVGASAMSLLVMSLFFPLHGLAQDAKLERFRSERKAAGIEKTANVIEFATANQIPVSFVSAEGDHFLLIDIRNGKPIYRMTLNAEAAITTGAVDLRKDAGLGFDLQGEGMLVTVFDEGQVKDHIELGERVIAKEGTEFGNHATHVTGTIIASGINAAAKGMAPKAKAATYNFDNDELKMAGLAAVDQTSLLLSNHSYGETTGWHKINGTWDWSGDASISSDEDFRFGFYGDRAKNLDQLAFLAPYYTIVWAAGNDRAEVGNGSRLPDCNGGTGFDCIIPDAVAKNIITVGAVNKVLSYNQPSSVQMSFFSSWGPTDDGRIKPDVVGAGVNLFSLSSNGTNTYTTMSGTSMATPNVTGSLLLLQELYSKMHGGNFMKASTLKALAIHTTKEAGNFPGPDYSFGWGLLDVSAAAQLIRNVDEHQVMINELTLNNNQTFEMEIHPQANKKITATIVWTDPAGSPVADRLDPADIMLVNDLDMRLTDEQGIQQFPWILDPLNPAKKASRGDNFRDNVEKIEFDAPQQKKYKLSIKHKGQLVEGHQNFSLILTYKTIDIMPKTYYWIADAGDWTDASHWSLSSGGTAAQATPTVNDKVVIDENSFDGLGSDFINLTQDVSVSTFVWLNSSPSGIQLNDKIITVGKKLIIASNAFVSSGHGGFHTANSVGEAGKILVKKAILPGITLTIDGQWQLSGEISLDEVNIVSGNLNATRSHISMKRLNAKEGLPKSIDFTKAQLSISENSVLESDQLTLKTDSSELRLDGDVSLNWNSINFSGQIIAQSGAITLNGNNHLSDVVLNANSVWNGSTQIDKLFVNSGVQLLLGNATELKLNSNAFLSGIQGKPVVIKSNSKAILNFIDHKKYCFDFLEVNAVDIGGGTVNAGLNSVVTNSNNWQQVKCEDVLFADFKVNYNCADSFAEFIDESQGAPDQWQWNFGSGVTSNVQNSKHAFASTGTYPVSLMVSKNGSSQVYQANVAINANTISQNTIAVQAEKMVSLLEGKKYEWYKDEELIAGANERSFTYDGEQGTYFVVVYDDQCNRPSDIVTVTEIEAVNENALKIYPNPAKDQLMISLPEGEEMRKVAIHDTMGREVLSRLATGNKIALDISGLHPSIYFIRIFSTTGETRQRVVISGN